MTGRPCLTQRVAAIALQFSILARIGHLLVTSGVVAKKLQLSRGYRLVINHGPDACESVPHLHVHLLAQRQLTWPPG